MQLNHAAHTRLITLFLLTILVLLKKVPHLVPLKYCNLMQLYAIACNGYTVYFDRP